jgi:hypothetical protein
MDNTKILNRDFEKVAWGMLLIWWGIMGLLDFLPHGTGAVGVGLILLGLNLVRSLKGIPTNFLSITLGTIALVWGEVELMRTALDWPPDLPGFAILLIVLGVALLVREFRRTRQP